MPDYRSVTRRSAAGGVQPLTRPGEPLGFCAVRWVVIVVLAASMLGGWNWWTRERAVMLPPGIVVPDDPVQVDLSAPRTFTHRGYQVLARAHYDITARVIRKEIYRLDGGAGLAPVDLGVGWGPMSDTAVLDRISFSQMGRFFYWDARDPAFPLPPKVLQTHAAQMHMVPPDEAMEARLKRLRPGQIVRIQGWLVDIRGPAGFTWNTSLRRDDTGSGACEIVYVDTLDVQ
jgi:hypothetical protein